MPSRIKVNLILYLVVRMSGDGCRLSSAGPRREVCRSFITMASRQGIVATDTHSQRLRRLVGEKELAIGACTTHNSSTFPTVMLGRKGGREGRRERGRREREREREREEGERGRGRRERE